MDLVPRILRTELDDGIFHVIARGVNRCAIYRDDEDRRTFVRLFARTVPRYGWDVHALCLMTTHYHVVLDTTVLRMYRGIQWMNGLYARLFNRRWDRCGHLFGERYVSKPIEDEDQLANTCGYVLLNPVRAGLCQDPRGWPWSGSKYGKSLD